MSNAPDAWPTERRAWLAFGGIAVTVLLAGLDRAILGLLIEPIRADLQLTDGEIGLLGLGFGLFYAVMALPFGWVTDRANRVRLLLFSVLFWSAMTALTGLARSFGQLFLARMGVGVGEASLMPASASLLADYFRPDRLPLAMSCFVACGLFGASFAFVAGGWLFAFAEGIGTIQSPLGALKPWQTTLILIGALGLAVSAVLALIPEPDRKGRMKRADAADTRVSLRDGLRFLGRRKRFILLHNLGFGLAGVYTFALFLWAPAFLTRTYGWSTAQAGTSFGLAMMIAGVPGIYGAGWLVSWLMRRGRTDAPLLVPVVGLALLVPVSVMAPLMASGEAAIVIMSLSMLLFSLPAAMPQASLQLITPNELRGKTIGLLTIATHAIGMSLGPTSVGFFNDVVFKDPQAIGRSLSIVSGVSVALAALLLALALPAYRRLTARVVKGRYDD